MRYIVLRCDLCGREIYTGEFYRFYNGKNYCGDRCVCESIGAEERKA